MCNNFTALNHFYKAETERLISSLDKAEYEKIMSYPFCEIEEDFVGFLHCYADLAGLPADFTVIDIGCNQAIQSAYFVNHKYIGVDIGIPTKYMYHIPSGNYYEQSGQQFVKETLPHLIEQGLDLTKTFAVCSYVPDTDCQKLIAQTFPYHRLVGYSFVNLDFCCDVVISAKYPQNFAPNLFERKPFGGNKNKTEYTRD